MSELLGNITDPRSASKTHEVLTSRAHALLTTGNPAGYFEHMRFARVVGKFLPITDPRNPDYISPVAEPSQNIGLSDQVVL